MMKSGRVEKGRVAEQRAIDFLRDLGYIILCRNYKVPGGEIDIIAMDDETVVFVEVRFRTDDEAEGSFGDKKVAALKRTATAYRTEMDLDENFRFDLIAMSPSTLRHHPDFI